MIVFQNVCLYLAHRLTCDDDGLAGYRRVSFTFGSSEESLCEDDISSQKDAGQQQQLKHGLNPPENHWVAQPIFSLIHLVGLTCRTGSDPPRRSGKIAVRPGPTCSAGFRHRSPALFGWNCLSSPWLTWAPENDPTVYCMSMPLKLDGFFSLAFTKQMFNLSHTYFYISFFLRFTFPLLVSIARHYYKWGKLQSFSSWSFELNWKFSL